MIGQRCIFAFGAAALALASCRASEPPPPPPRSESLVSPEAAVVPAPEASPAAVAEVATPEPLALPDPEPEPEQPPVFEGRTKVTVDELVAELELVAQQMAEAPAVRADYDALVAANGLADTEALYRDYVRVKLAFESTRDAGFWGLRWDITNEQPNSDQIWAQWKKLDVSQVDDGTATATAECDELSALFAFIARKLGVRHIGLFWPQWNHVVAVWTVQSTEDSPVRIVVPTSQIFLGADDSLGTEGFDPWTQKKIFEYRRKDVKGSHRLDANLARFFVEQARSHASLSQVELQRLRNERDLTMNPPES